MDAQPKDAGLHHNNFNLLRLFFAACVIVFHAYPLLLGQKVLDAHRTPLLILQTLSHGQTDLGTIAVDCFFVISGFLVTSSYERSRTALDYLRKRSLRIFPGLAAAVVVCIFVVAPLGGAPFPQYLLHPATYKIVTILTMRHVIYNDLIPGAFYWRSIADWKANVSPKMPFSADLIGTAWTLQFEFACYLLVMALGVIGIYRHPRRALWVTGGLFVLSMAALAHWGDVFPVTLPWFGSIAELPRFAAYFLAGSLAYLLREKIPHSRVIALVCLVAIVLFHSHHLIYVLPLALTYLLLYVAFSRSAKFHRFGDKVDLSYGLYLYGWPVEQLLVYYFRPHLTPLLLMSLAMPITAALAWVSWTLVERPCLRLKMKFARRPASLNAAASGKGTTEEPLTTHLHERVQAASHPQI